MQAQSTVVENWSQLETIACRNLVELGLHGNKEYIARLKFEIEEINKQAANRYWINLYNAGRKFDHNRNGLVFPFLLGLTPIDPVKAQWTYCVDQSGPISMDIITLTLEDGSLVEVPAKSLVCTKRGNIAAADLEPGDEFL